MTLLFGNMQQRSSH